MTAHPLPSANYGSKNFVLLLKNFLLGQPSVCAYAL